MWRLKVEWVKTRSEKNLSFSSSMIIRAQNNFASIARLIKFYDSCAGLSDTATMPLPSQVLFLLGFSCLMQAVHITLASGRAMINYEVI